MFDATVTPSQHAICRWSHSKSSTLQCQPTLTACNCVWNLWSSDTPLMCRPFTKTDFARRGFRYSAPAVWNSLPEHYSKQSSNPGLRLAF